MKIERRRDSIVLPIEEMEQILKEYIEKTSGREVHKLIIWITHGNCRAQAILKFDEECPNSAFLRMDSIPVIIAD